jgi:hypothetical protein
MAAYPTAKVPRVRCSPEHLCQVQWQWLLEGPLASLRQSLRNQQAIPTSLRKSLRNQQRPE